jgi:hypothetical protein
MRTPEKLYEFHVANLNAIVIALDRVALTLREAIAKNDIKTMPSFMRLYALLLASWAECRLSKLLYEPNGFSNLERSGIVSRGTQIDRWMATIEFAFRKHYNIPNAVLSINTLPHSAWSKYESVVKLVDIDLRPIIELRNKLAHGQWVFPLNDGGNDVAQAQMDALRLENLLSLQFKKSLITSLSGIVNDLVVSRPTFERDFDQHYQLIVQTKRNLEKRSYQVYVSNIQEKYERGKIKRNNNLTSSL